MWLTFLCIPYYTKISLPQCFHVFTTCMLIYSAYHGTVPWSFIPISYVCCKFSSSNSFCGLSQFPALPAKLCLDTVCYTIAFFSVTHTIPSCCSQLPPPNSSRCRDACWNHTSIPIYSHGGNVITGIPNTGHMRFTP